MRIFSHYKTDGLFWFRIFGVGLVIKNIEKHKPLFGERNGYRKYIQIGKIRILTLT